MVSANFEGRKSGVVKALSIVLRRSTPGFGREVVLRGPLAYASPFGYRQCHPALAGGLGQANRAGNESALPAYFALACAETLTIANHWPVPEPAAVPMSGPALAQLVTAPPGKADILHFFLEGQVELALHVCF